MKTKAVPILSTRAPKRIIHCAEALTWLKEQPPFDGCSFITSLPDISEIRKLSIPEWKSWFVGAVATILELCPPNGAAIFFQTDVKKGGLWIDKAQLCHAGAKRADARLLWHKIVCRHPAGKTTFGQTGYSHMLCFSKGILDNIERSTPDVLPMAGEKLWKSGMGLEACKVACEFILNSTKTRTVVDPFCGQGSILAVANSLGLNAIGVDISSKRVEQSRRLNMKNPIKGALSEKSPSSN